MLNLSYDTGHHGYTFQTKNENLQGTIQSLFICSWGSINVLVRRRILF